MIIIRRRGIRLFPATIALSLCGCATLNVHTGGPPLPLTPGSSQVQIQASTDSRLGTVILVSVLLAEGVRYFLQMADGRRTPLEREEAQRLRGTVPMVSEQDCSRPIDPSQGNLYCR